MNEDEINRRVEIMAEIARLEKIGKFALAESYRKVNKFWKRTQYARSESVRSYQEGENEKVGYWYWESL